MTLLVTSEPLPFVTDADGVIRVGGTRVTLDTLVTACREGMTAEGIVEQYPTLRLPDVYLAIGYFLSHQEAVEAYLHDRQQFAAEVRRENVTRFDPAGVRDRLTARRSQG
jgi:uncharacterized protein (DUF433 family)